MQFKPESRKPGKMQPALLHPSTSKYRKFESTAHAEYTRRKQVHTHRTCTERITHDTLCTDSQARYHTSHTVNTFDSAFSP